MTYEWEQLKNDLSPWITPDALDHLADSIPSPKMDLRALLLQLAERFGRDRRLGLALRIVDEYRDPSGAYYPMSSTAVIGAVRFMFEAAGPGDAEDFVEQQLRRHLSPNMDPWVATWRGEQTMGFSAYARSADEVRASALEWAKSVAEVKAFGEALAAKKIFRAADDPSAAEAGKWLRTNKNPSPLANNRFQTKANAIAFVKALYAAGATRVLADNINPTPDEGGSYADSMLVDMPSDPAKRAAVIAVINDLGQPDTDGGPVTDGGEGTLGLWWD